jgi:hypothetical protein
MVSHTRPQRNFAQVFGELRRIASLAVSGDNPLKKLADCWRIGAIVSVLSANVEIILPPIRRPTSVVRALRVEVTCTRVLVRR